MEIKVGDYVRFDGEIAKVTSIKRYKTKEDIYVFDRILDLDEDRSCNYNTIYNSQWKYFDNVKSSPNIIDLIEVGDYVNGIYIEGNKGRYLETLEHDIENSSLGHIEYLKIYPNDIKSIVTKEQFSQMEYKIND